MAGRADGRVRGGVPRFAAEVIRATIRANQKCFVLREQLPPSSVMAVPGLDPATHGAPSGAKADGHATRNGVDGRHKAGHDAGESAGKLANKFILVSNLVAADGGAAIAAGNGRVVRARLADARHFWQTDLAALPDAKNKDAEAARPALGETGARRLSREAWNAGRADQAHRGSWHGNLRQGSTLTSPMRRARPISPRLILRPKWSASSLSFRA